MDLRKVSDEEKVNLCRKYTIHIFNYYYLFLNPFFFSFTWYLLSVVVVFHCAFLRDRSICYVLKLKALYHFELDLIL